MNPFRIEGPACISFSGGRTSAFMLYKIIEAWGGKLPDDVVVCFANTGKEMPETLDFVEECSKRWGVKITWLEYRTKVGGKKAHNIVTHSTASRNGEPYSMLIEDRKYLPNVFARFCTVELKIRPMHRFLRGLGFEYWDSCIGIRADEPYRIAKVRARGFSNETKDETPVMPLVDAGISVRDVLRFWKSHDFDLKLTVNAKGISPGGNCDLCFLKKANMIMSLIREQPERAVWWMKQEAKVTEIGATRLASGALFRLDRPSYSAMHDMATTQQEMFDYPDEPIADCMCTD